MEKNKLALITGASNGIGYELSKIFARNGYNLILVARGEEKLQETKDHLADYKSEVSTYSADLSKYDEIINFKQWIDQNNIKIDVLVLNAGRGLGGSFINSTDLKEELNLIRLNIDSIVHMSKLFIGDMVKRNEGKVLMTSSISGTAPIPFEAVYGASKAFVNSFFFALRNEISITNVRMTLLLPGATETNFFENAGQSDTKVGSMDKDDPKDVAERAYYALDSNHEFVYGSDDAEYEGEVLNRALSASHKAQKHRKISEPGSAEDDN